MHVGDNGYRTGIPTGRASEGWTLVAAFGAARRVGPMQGRIDRQEVGQEVAVRIQQFIDPLDAHRGVPLGLNCQ
jgi:hypothetical protein